MRISLPNPSEYSGGEVTALHGDEFGIGRICYVGPWAFIFEYEPSEHGHFFLPEMKHAILERLDRKYWRIGFFCTEKTFERMQQLSQFYYKHSEWFKSMLRVSILFAIYFFVVGICVLRFLLHS